ncbi:MAG: hypothetical protein ACI9WU_001367 [Myxococcota bacterium]|jgi:hypothetical protein
MTVDRRGSVALTRPEHTVVATSVTTPLPDLSRQFSVGPVLGEGGMGIVSAATQHPLGRQVAVKRARQELGHPVSEALVSEAVIQGLLEHPNLVPVHQLGSDESGQPVLIMKRVEGRTWDEVLAEGNASGAALEGHLRTLLRLCDAISFAHSRGILHLDLKPNNVMIGSFGEVYVLDWGTARSFRPDVPGLPAASIKYPLGTPDYMPPELALGDGSRVDQRADVYLLGSCLYEVVSGRTPHHGEALIDVLSHAAFEIPEPLLGADAELSAIVTRAMASDPQARFGSVVALQQALGEYLAERPGIELARKALVRATQVEQALQAGQAEEAYQAFVEARFALRQITDQYPNNRPAALGLETLLETMIRHEIQVGDGKAAGRLHAELARPNPQLEAEIQALRARKVDSERELAQMRAIRWSVDAEPGSEVRRAIFLSFIAFPLFYIGLGLLHRAGIWSAGYPALAAILGLYGPTLLVLKWVLRDRLPDTLMNRYLMTTVGLTWLAPVMVVWAGWTLSWPPMVIPAMTIVLFLIVASVYGIINRRYNVWFVALHVVIFPIAIRFPDYAFDMLGIATAAGLIIGAASRLDGPLAKEDTLSTSARTDA